MKDTKKIALTGVMGAGKSSVIAYLTQLQIAVLDCDAINRELIRKGAKGYQAIVKTFGDSILDAQGNLDKQAMSNLIFADEKKRQCLEQILHPMIREEITTFCETTPKRLVVVEVPLLFEVHWEAYFDEIWVVTCARETLLQRLEVYRHISRKEALKRLSHQMSAEEKCQRADVILSNDGNQEQLQAQIMRELTRIQEA